MRAWTSRRSGPAGSGVPPRSAGWSPRPRLEARQLVLPVFVREGIAEPQPISSMPGVVQHTRDSLRKAAAEAAAAGLGGVMLFGIPESKDATGSGALDPDGILNVAIADVKAEVGDAVTVMSDLCLDEFTDHGHCGRPRRRRPGRQRRHPRAVRRDGARARRCGCRHGRAQRDDGRPGAVIRSALDGVGAPGRLDPRVLREVRLRVLRPVPRGGGLLAGRGPPDLPAGLRPTPSKASARRCSTSPRAPTS